MINSLPKIQYSIGGITYDVSNVFKQLQYTIPPTKIFTTTVEYGERPDQISNRLYGTPDYYWSIILANKDNPFINPIERLGESTKTTLELEAGEDIDPRDFFIQFSRSAFDVYIDDIDPVDFAALGLTGNTELTDHRVVDFYKSVIPGDIIVVEPQNENVFSFGAGQQKIGITTSNQYYPQYGQSSIPNKIIKDNIKIIGAAAGDKWSAILDTNGGIHVWGGISLSNNLTTIEENYYKSTTSGYTFISSADDLLLAIRSSDGGVTCFGNCGRFNGVYNNEKNFKKIVWSKGTTGFGLGISGNAYYYNIQEIDSGQYTVQTFDGDYNKLLGITFSVSGKDELYIFGGITANFGITGYIEKYFNGLTFPNDIACTKNSCFCLFNNFTKYQGNIADYNKSLFRRTFFDLDYRNLIPPTLNNIVEYNASGIATHISTIKNSLSYKTYMDLYERAFQTIKNAGGYTYNVSTNFYQLDTQGISFNSYLKTFTELANNLDHTTPSYTRNPSFWLDSTGPKIDITSIPVWQSHSDTFNGMQRPGWTRGGIPLTKQHILIRNHFPIPVGATIRWVTNDNQVVERTLLSSMRLPAQNAPTSFTDIVVGLLNAPLPDSIKIPKLWSYDNNQEYIDPNMVYYGLVSDQFRRLKCMAFYFSHNTQSASFVYHSPRISSDKFLGSLIFGNPYTINLDSNSPAFMVYDNELITLGSVYTYGQFDRGAISDDYLQSYCNTLSDTWGEDKQNIQFFVIDEGWGLTKDLLEGSSGRASKLFSNKNNLFAGYEHNKQFNFDSVNNEYQRYQPLFYSGTIPPYEFYIPYGLDSALFKTIRQQIKNTISDTNFGVYNYSFTDSSVFVVTVPNTGVQIRQYGTVDIWNNTTNKSIGINNIFPTSLKYNYVYVNIDYVEDENGNLVEIITSDEPQNSTAGLNDIANDLILEGGAEHVLLAQKNKTPQATPNYFQVTFVDSAFKRLFVKDLNGNAKSFINSDPACSRFSIIRKDANGTYRIIKLQNNSLRGIMSSKALRTISKVYDLSNANPSNEQTWNDYLSLLESYMNGTLSTLGGLSTINTSINGNPVEIKYYEKEYVAELASNIPKLLKL